MIKYPALCLVFLTIYLNSWLPVDTSVVFALANPASEDPQTDRAVKDAFLPGKVREDLDIARALEDFIPTSQNDEDNSCFCSNADIDKRRLRESKRRLRGSKRSFNEDKRRLRFVKKNVVRDDDAFPDGELYPRLRYHNLRRR